MFLTLRTISNPLSWLTLQNAQVNFATGWEEPPPASKSSNFPLLLFNLNKKDTNFTMYCDIALLNEKKRIHVRDLRKLHYNEVLKVPTNRYISKKAPTIFRFTKNDYNKWTNNDANCSTGRNCYISTLLKNLNRLGRGDKERPTLRVVITSRWGRVQQPPKHASKWKRHDM